MKSPKPHNTIWCWRPMCLSTSTTLHHCSPISPACWRRAAWVALLPTLRFAHGRPYLRDVISAAGLKLVTLEEAAIRTEKGTPVAGLVVVAIAART
jgi:hypothetical protein